MLEQLKTHLISAVEDCVSPELRARLDRLEARLNEYGVDPFGFDPRFITPALPFIQFFYQKYFRVQCEGIEQLPAGRVLLISNHSGQLPIDAMMIVSAVFFHAEPPRMLRSMVETWVPTLPFVSYLFPRWGQIVGTRDNCLRLLEREEAILAFPEGVRGISKPFSQRYQLQEFGLGFMRLALMSNAPVVPVAVVGAEEQAPALANVKPLARLMGFPAFPVTPTFPWLGPLGLLPLPSRYRITFGKPMRFTGNPDDEDQVISQKVSRVRQTIQRMLHDGLKAREHVFW